MTGGHWGTSCQTGYIGNAKLITATYDVQDCSSIRLTFNQRWDNNGGSASVWLETNDGTVVYPLAQSEDGLFVSGGVYGDPTTIEILDFLPPGTETFKIIFRLMCGKPDSASWDIDDVKVQGYL
jgi:hypothetical protein